MYQEIAIFCFGFAAGYLVKKNQNSFLYSGLSLLTALNKWRQDVKQFFTNDYLVNAVAYLEKDNYTILDCTDFDITEDGFVSYKELLPLPLVVSYNYRKEKYMIKLKDATQINNLKFKFNNKSINNLLSVMVDGKEVLPELKTLAGPYYNFYQLNEVTFNDLYPECNKIEVINSFGDLENFKGNVNIISLI